MADNQYEPLRQDVAKIIRDECVKEAENKAFVAYSWNIGKVFATVEKVLLKGEKLPESLKLIVRFEFNKLRDATMAMDGWNHTRTREVFAYADNQVIKRKAHTFQRDNLTLDEQLLGALALLDNAGKRLAKAKNEEETHKAKKIVNKYHKEVTFLRDAISVRDEVLTAHAKKEAAPEKVAA